MQSNGMLTVCCTRVLAMFRQTSMFYFAVLITCCLTVTSAVANDCDGSREMREATLASIKTFIHQQQKAVLTFAGYSGTRYQDPGAMMEQASRLLDGQDPLRTLIKKFEGFVVTTQ